MIKVSVAVMKESHRTTFYVVFLNEHGETQTPHYFEERPKAVFTAAEYAWFFRDIDAFEQLSKELKETDPVMYKLLEMHCECEN